MSTEGEFPAAPDDPLRLDRCPECGYLLAGLPEVGVCPECGTDYAPGPVVLYGYGFGAHQTIINTRHNPIWELLGTSIFLLVFGLRGLLRHSWSAIFWLLLIAYQAIASLAYRRQILTDAPAPSQLRLTPDGYCQRDGVGSAVLRPWGNRKEEVKLTRQGEGLYRLVIGKPIRPMRLASTPQVEFEFRCGDETAGRITLLIGEWRRAAGVPSGVNTDARRRVSI